MRDIDADTGGNPRVRARSAGFNQDAGQFRLVYAHIIGPFQANVGVRRKQPGHIADSQRRRERQP